jgi:hypothetical protein
MLELNRIRGDLIQSREPHCNSAFAKKTLHAAISNPAQYHYSKVFHFLSTMTILLEQPQKM